MQKERALLIEHLKLSKGDKDKENANVTPSYLKSYLISLSKGFYMIYKRENYLNKIREEDSMMIMRWLKLSLVLEGVANLLWFSA